MYCFFIYTSTPSEIYWYSHTLPRPYPLPTSLRFPAYYVMSFFRVPFIMRLLATPADCDTYRCSIAEWPVNERPPLYVHRGVVSTLRVDGPLQDAGRTYLPLGGLIETPFVTAHLDPVEAQRLDSQVQRSEEHTSELQSLMRISYAVFCLKTKTLTTNINTND